MTVPTPGQKGYGDLLCLFAPTLEAWIEQTGFGMMMFSRWREVRPNMSYGSCWNALIFQSHKQFVNSSRFNLQDVLVRSVPGAKAKYNLHLLDRRPALCLTSGYCKESHVLEPSERVLKRKSAHVIPHSQEYERLASLMGTAFGYRSMHAQLGMDAIQFTIKADFRNSSGSQSNTTTLIRLTNTFSNVTSCCFTPQRHQSRVFLWFRTRSRRRKPSLRLP